MRIAIPVFEGVVATSVLGMYDMLMLSRYFVERMMGRQADWFEVELVGVESDSVSSLGSTIKPHQLMTDGKHYDMVILPAVVGHFPTLLSRYQPMIEWLTSSMEKGTKLSSTCTGAFFIAATGVLDGKEGTVSWFAKDEFAALYPAVDLKDEKMLIDNGTSITTGATLSFQYLSIYLIEKYYGKQAGNIASKMFLVDKSRDEQASFAMFSQQLNHDDEAIRTVQKWLEQHLLDQFSIADLASMVAIAERTFIRRFKAATGNTPLEYIQRLKIEHAKHLLEDSQLNVKDVGYQTGYEDLSYFRNMFKKYTGLTPADYKKQFSFKHEGNLPLSTNVIKP